MCLNNIALFAVESPSHTFQRLRNYVDAVNCNALPSFQAERLKQGFSNEMATEAKTRLKINKVYIHTTTRQAEQKSLVPFMNFHNNYGDVIANVLANKCASRVLSRSENIMYP